MLRAYKGKLAIVTALLAWGCDSEKPDKGIHKSTSTSYLDTPHRFNSGEIAAADQPMPADSSATASKLAQELGWLVGKWVDDEADVTATSTYSWDKYNNFLLQHFSMQIPQQKVLEGQQIIAWDPAKQRLRAWIFDSDGGFGHSLWSQQGASWYENIVFTLVDGRKASATHIYTKIDDHTYTFASEDRDVDGKLLPNVGPFKFVREQEQKR